MKQRKLNLMYLLLMAVFVLSSCSKKSAVAKFIPEDQLVASIDVQQLFEKSKMGNSEASKAMWLSAAQDGVSKQETKDLIKKIAEDPAKAGIDLREPIYLYGSNDAQSIVGTILDKGNFTELLNGLAKEYGFEAVKEKDGVQYLVSGDYNIVFDDAIFVGSSKKVDDIIAQFKNEDTKETMAENADFEKLVATQGVIKMLVPGDMVSAVFNEQAKALPEGLNVKDISAIVSIKTDKGVATFTAEALPKSEAWKKKIEESTDYFGNISGDYMKYVQKGAFVLYANLKGAKIYEELEKADILKQINADNQKEIVKAVLNAIDGDFVLGAKGVENSYPEITSYIKTKDASLSDMAKEAGFSSGDGVSIGFKDGATFCIVGKTAPFTEAKDGYDTALVKGRRIYLACDIQQLSSLVGSVNSEYQNMAKQAANFVTNAEIYDTSDTACELKLTMSDKEKDPIEVLIQALMNQ